MDLGAEILKSGCSRSNQGSLPLSTALRFFRREFFNRIGRVQPPAIALATRGAWNSHNLFLRASACDCTCESKGNAGFHEAKRPPPPRRRFPRHSHRINALTPILSPCVAWCCLKVERAMGIEPTRAVLPELKNKRFGAMANSRCD